MELVAFKNTAENVRMSEIAADLGLHINGEFFLQNGKPVGKAFAHNAIAISPQAMPKKPAYLKQIPVARIRR